MTTQDVLLNGWIAISVLAVYCFRNQTETGDLILGAAWWGLAIATAIRQFIIW